MKYQLRYLLHQLEHRKVLQLHQTGLVEEWVFPLEKSARLALEHLELPPQVVQDWHLKAESQVQVQAVEVQQGQQQAVQDEVQAQAGAGAEAGVEAVVQAEVVVRVQELESELAKARLRVSELEMALESAHSKVWWKE